MSYLKFKLAPLLYKMAASRNTRNTNLTGGSCPPFLGGAFLATPFFEFWARGKCTQTGYSSPLTTHTVTKPK